MIALIKKFIIPRSLVARLNVIDCGGGENDEIPLGLLPVCLSVCQLSVCQLSVCQLSVYQLSVCQLSVCYLSVDLIGWPIRLPAHLFPSHPRL